MKRIVILVIIMILLVSCFTYLVLVNCGENESEFVPEGEISDVDLRNTIITLYFDLST